MIQLTKSELDNLYWTWYEFSTAILRILDRAREEKAKETNNE